jgi:hypothetical protein
MTALFSSHLIYTTEIKRFKSKAKENGEFSACFASTESEKKHLPSKYIFKGVLYFLTLTLLLTLKRCQGHFAGRRLQQISNSVFALAVAIPIFRKKCFLLNSASATMQYLTI